MANTNEPNASAIQFCLKSFLPVEAVFERWKRSDGQEWFAVIAMEDPDDRYTSKIGADDEPAERKPWQRRNVVMAMGTDLDRVLWEGKRGTWAPMELTLWFDRVFSRYHVGPRCARHGKTGRPTWADIAVQMTANEPGRLVAPAGLGQD